MRHSISNIEIEKIENDPKGLIGFCNFILDEKIRFRGIAIFSRLEGGIRLSYPEKKRGLKTIKTAEPINPETFQEIETEILGAMNNAEKTQ